MVEGEEAVADQLESDAGDCATDGVERAAKAFESLQRARRADPDEPHRRAGGVLRGRVRGGVHTRRDDGHAVGGYVLAGLGGEGGVAGEHNVRGPHDRPEAVRTLATVETLRRVRVAQPQGVVEVED